MSRLDTSTPIVELPQRRMLRLDLRRGTCVRVLAGSAWVTVEGDPEDRFLERGECVRIARTGRTVVEALRPATLEVRRATTMLDLLCRSLGLRTAT